MDTLGKLLVAGSAQRRRKGRGATRSLILLAFAFVAACGGTTTGEPAEPAGEVSPTRSPSEVTSQAGQPGSYEEGTIAGVLAGDGRFQTFLQILEEKADDRWLVDLQSSVYGAFTVFAPTDEAFAAVEAGRLEALVDDEERLRDFIGTHVVIRQSLGSDDLVAEAESGDGLVTAIRGFLKVEVDSGQLRIAPCHLRGGECQPGEARATVVEADNEASNGLIHAIDAVVMP